MNATRATGVIVHVDAGDFQALIKRAVEPMILVARGGVFKKHYQYMTTYKGLAFFTRSDRPLEFAGRHEKIMVKKLWIPD